MHRGRQRPDMAAMAALGPPATRALGRIGQDQHQPPGPGYPAHRLKQRPSLRIGGGVMAKDNARLSLGKCCERGPEVVAQTFVGHEPYGGQGVVALRHPPLYSRGMTEDAKHRLNAVHHDMARACKIAGRAPESVTLVAVSKTQSAEAIRPLLAAGQRVFGENRVQEAQSKWPELMAETPGIELHLVGQLQSNKAEEAVRLFDVIHSVDRLSLITALGRAQEKTGRRPRHFLQVNIGEEAQKGGCAAIEVPELLAQARAVGLDVVGLMAVPPADTEAAPYFALLAKIAKELGLSELSMGMSGDYEAAIMLGATQIRIGTALFGARG